MAILMAENESILDRNRCTVQQVFDDDGPRAAQFDKNALRSCSLSRNPAPKIAGSVRRDLNELPFAIELVVNGHGSGVVEAVARWQDYELFVTVAHLRPGFNDFELCFSAENDTEDH